MRSRTNSGSPDHFDLFPYVAILMSFLGALLTATLGIASLSLGPGVGETWDMGTRDGASNKTPVLVEWDGSSLLVHEGKVRRRVPWLDSETPSEVGTHTRSATMEQLLTAFRSRSATHYALFAVRPSGFETLPRLADDFRAARIDIGYEPVDQERSVQLMTTKGRP